MKFDTAIPAAMLAPCGLNCAACYAHLRTKKTCAGCRGGEDGQPQYCRRCKIRNCAIQRGVDFCFECSLFPCPPVKHIDKRYRLRYHVHLIENANRVKDIGIESFLAEEKRKWSCAQCGGIVCLHNRICSECGKEMELSA